MNQRRSGSAEPNRTSKLRFFWEDHKFVVILVSCLVLPFIFVPVWILVYLVFRVRNVLERSRQPLASDQLTDVAGIHEQSFADRGTKMEKVEQVASSVGLFFSGFIAVVGVMLCVLGWEVIGRASGQPGGGIALLLGYSLFAGGVIATFVGVFGLAKRLSQEGR